MFSDSLVFLASVVFSLLHSSRSPWQNAYVERVIGPNPTRVTSIT